MYCETEQKGMLAEIKILESLIRKGHIVSTPFGGKAAYDCLFDNGIDVFRVQVKYGSLIENENRSRISFHTCTFRKDKDGKTISVSRKDEVDFFGIYVEELNQCYLIPSNLVGGRQGSLSLSGTNGHKLLLAEDYKI
jgi:hypothetical protein